MPWHIAENYAKCPASEPYAVINERTGELERGGCHATREEAVAHQRALYANEPAASRAQMVSSSINDLPDSAFAYIEPGGKKDDQGRTVPRSLRHFPIHDAAHVRNALARAPQSPFGAKAMPKIRAAAKKFGIEVSGDGRSMEGTLMAVDVELRVLPGLVEARRIGDQPHIGGYAAKFNIYSRNLGGFVEQYSSSFFNKSRGDGWPDAMARFNHDDSMLLGTTAGRTLQLSIDSVGLEYDVVPPESMRHVVEWVERGDVQKSSTAFRTLEDDWGVTEDGGPLRTLVTGVLVDVAPVTVPAYVDTTAGLRSLAVAKDADLEEVRSLAKSGELRKLFVRTDSGAGAVKKPKVFGPTAAVALLARRQDPWS